jgi:protease PrsW
MTVFSKSWFQVLITGTILFFATEYALRASGNLSWLTPVILLGALVVPVSFVTYFYGQERFLDKNIHGGTPFKTAALCFFVGGLIGVIVAAVLELGTLNSLNASGLFFVGVIEEAAKVIFPIVIYVRARNHFRSEIDGLLFGTATGMGFAALETIGYALVALVQSRGNVGTLEEVLLIRGLLSPVGHAAWTGLICAALWHSREKTGKMFNPSVLGAYAIAVVLHFLWDLNSMSGQPILIFLGYVVIGAVGITLLARRIREARRGSHNQKDPA